MAMSLFGGKDEEKTLKNIDETKIWETVTNSDFYYYAAQKAPTGKSEDFSFYQAIERLDKAYDRLFRDLNTRASVYKAKINFYKDLLNYIGPSK
jgi:hypothetical protein